MCRENSAFVSSPLTNFRKRNVSMSVSPINGKDIHRSASISISDHTKSKLTSNIPKVEKRPELVGGLPLWLAKEAITQARKIVQTFSQTASSEKRKKNISEIQTKLDKSDSSQPTDDIPVTKILRTVADTIEEEMECLRQVRDVSQTEAAESKKLVEATKAQLEQIHIKYSQNQIDAARKEMKATLEHMRVLLCKEQTRSAAAIKHLIQLEQSLVKIEREKNQMEQDIIKFVILYTGAMVMIFVALSKSSIGVSLLQQLTANQF